MDFHVGILMENCDPVIRQLRANGVPFFTTRHLKAENDAPSLGREGRHKLLSLFVQDPGGAIIELTCWEFSLVSFAEVPEWDFCRTDHSEW